MGQTEADLAVPLASINGQIGVNFSEIDVHLVNDGGQSIQSEKFDIFSHLNLHYHELKENVGPGMARQYGIDQSKGEYIMFVDADDELHYAGALLDFFNVFKIPETYDVIIGRYLEQYIYQPDGTFRYRTHPSMDKKAVYAKAFRRVHLENIDLKFHPDLRIFEDNYFVGLACMLAQNLYDLNSVVYSWLYNPNSIVRSDKEFFSHQTLAVVKSMHPYLEKLANYRPEFLMSTVDGYMNNIFLRYSILEEKYHADFWPAHKRLLEDFKDYYSGYHAVAQGLVNENAQMELYRSVDTSKFEDFVKQSLEKKGLS